MTLTQALQLVALAPCLLVIAFLLISGKRRGLIAAAYFASLSCGFLIPLLPMLGIHLPPHLRPQALAMLQFGESFAVPLSFLLCMQFLLSRIPPPAYWLVLALPLIGGSPFIYAAMLSHEICLQTQTCLDTAPLARLYHLFSTAAVLLLLVYHLSRRHGGISASDRERRHKYWLIFALAALNVMLAALSLAVIGERVTERGGVFPATVLRIAFIYLALTSIFRVFYDVFGRSAPGLRRGEATQARHRAADEAAVARIRALMEEEKLYREMRLTRALLAEKLGMSEQQASRIINNYFRKSFNELVNGYRVAEARERLLAEPDAAITVIAFDAGFSSLATFNRAFKEVTGTSPTEFRAAASAPARA